MPPWDDGLEGPALEIARTDRSPVRVDAGPGTGKTFALMRRVWRLIAAGADPRRIFVGTFTRTAASDLKKSLRTRNSRCRQHTRWHDSRLLLWPASTTRRLRMDAAYTTSAFRLRGRFLVEDIGPEFGTVDERQKRLEAFAAAWARRQSEEPGWPTDPTDRRCHHASLGWLQFHEAMLIGELIAIANSYLRANPAPVFDHVLVDEYQDLNRGRAGCA